MNKNNVNVDLPVTAKEKNAAIAALRESESAIAARIDAMFAKGEIQVDDEGNVSGCGRVCRIFFGRRRSSGSTPTARQQNGVEAAVFGKRGKTLSANDRLDQAAESVSNHAAQLSERAGAARERARALATSGKRAEAMVALKRAKGLDKQAESATATHAAIEAQKDLLDGQELQREIASALAASVATTKSKTKGLLSKTEDAVDSLEEMRDAFEEVGQVLGGLQPATDVDEDDLAAELDEMIAAETPEESDASGNVKDTSDSIKTAEVVAAFPAAPKTRKEEKQGLLKNDSAAL